ncbi:MAG: hypothetical protein L3K02_00700 [Thermoplasmata archaeon]|nr:hypothetical protein [Thermoplasmata archaeon]
MALPPVAGVVAIAQSNTGSTRLTTSPPVAVSAGSTVYVHVALLGSGPSVQSVSDSENGVYTPLTSGSNGSVNLFIFRRDGPLADSSAFTVTVVPSVTTIPIQVAAVEVFNDGGVDSIGSLSTGTSSPEGSNVTSTLPNDLVLFFGADTNVSSPHFPAGQFALAYPSGLPGLYEFGSYQLPVATGSASSQRTFSGSTTWVCISVAISPANEWASIASRPFVTVSPIGRSVTGGLINDGADFGPDTPNTQAGPTQTNGIQEALNSIAETGGVVYCRAGTYVLQAPIGNTGSYQTVIFEAGCTITGLSTYLGTTTSPGEALFWIAQDVAIASYGATASYHHIQWLGNGCVINLYDSANAAYIGLNYVFEYTVNGPKLIGGLPQAYLVELSGFDIINPSGNLLWFQTNNGYGSHPDVTQQAILWKISCLHAYQWNSSSPQLGRGFGISSVRLFHIDRVNCDFTDVVTPSDGVNPGFSGLFIWSQRGDTSDIYITNSIFLMNRVVSAFYPSQIVELQGSTSSVGGEITSRIFFDNCVIGTLDTIETPPIFPGIGGGLYIDDSINTGNGAFITDVEFKNCEFVRVGIQFASQDLYFGFMRFTNCRFTLYPGANPAIPSGTSPFSGTLLGRSPGQKNTPFSPTGSPYTYMNNYGFDVVLVVSPASVTSISQNYNPTGLTSGAFFLRPGDSLYIVYTGTAPVLTETAE